MIWLRYKMAYDSTWTQRQFETLDIRTTFTVERLRGKTLRRRGYGKTMARHRIHTVVIGPDELQAAGAQDFIVAFCGADLMQVSFRAIPVATDDEHGTFVTMDGGDEPVDFVDGYTALREYTLRLDEEDPY